VAEPIRLGLAQGIVALEINDGLRDQIPAAALAEVAALEAKIRSGELVVPRGSF